MLKKRNYSSLKKSMIGFKIAKKDGDHDKLKYYAEGIQKFERQLRLPVADFSNVFKEENNLANTKQKEGGDATIQ